MRDGKNSGDVSLVSTKGQLVVPRAVRARLGLRPGDRVRFREWEGNMLIEKVSAAPKDDPFITFEEWTSAADEEAFRDL
jgi:AbrB family looped-hinge helix DNA binding protein